MLLPGHRRRRLVDFLDHVLQRQIGKRVIGGSSSSSVLKQVGAQGAHKVGRVAALAVNGPGTAGATAHERKPVHGVEFAALLAEALDRFAGVRGRVQLVEGVVLQLPGGVPVRHVDTLLPHALPELLRVGAQRTLEEVAGGEGQRAEAAPMKDAVAAIVLDAVAGKVQGVTADDAGGLLVVLVPVLGVVSMAVRVKGAQELRQTATLHAARQVEHPTAARLGAVDARIRVATVPAFLERNGVEKEDQCQGTPGQPKILTVSLINSRP